MCVYERQRERTITYMHNSIILQLVAHLRYVTISMAGNNEV